MTASNGRPEPAAAAGGAAPEDPGGRKSPVDPVDPADPVDPGDTATGRCAGAAYDDTVAAVVRQWRTVHPDLDTAPMEIIGRINRCAALLQQAEDTPLRRAGLSRPEFDMLGALRRTGRELTPSELARETFCSGAAVTKRLKQLTERGLVERRGDARDRRVAHVHLTESGRDLVDDLLPEQLDYERTVLDELDGEGRGELSELLSRLLGRLEGCPGAHT
ncbi:MarR family transcriptional regulator [Streptomyces sp. NPDC046985]|uniref:MarR family winged helix-turn-helix transcriptional regulator n=1 Tax=Streptomyces sp. NPDC046985 TaxID=3155377 RepID=UPI0033E144AF